MPDAPSRPRRQPSYRLHKPTGMAVVTLDGRDFYLGRHGTPESRSLYNRKLAEWNANGCTITPPKRAGLSVAELIAAHWRHAERYYRKADGSPAEHLHAIRSAMRPLASLYADSPADDFGPLALQAVRRTWVAGGLSRKTCNRYAGLIVKCFRWGVAQELVEADTLRKLEAVGGLRRGKTDAAEPEAVRPVPLGSVNAVRPFVSRQVWALIQLQLFTGARSGELVKLRPVDIDTADPACWFVRPAHHKTAHHGKTRAIPIGPQGQAVIRPFLPGRAVDAYLFSPIEAEAERREACHAARQTPMNQGNRPDYSGRTRDGGERRNAPKEHYTTNSYCHAIQRACERAFPSPAGDELEAIAERHRAEGMKAEKARKRAATDRPDLVREAEAWRKAHNWHPHQLRHNRATEVRAAFGIDLAKASLGHSTVSATAIYAEADEAKAREVAVKMG